MFLVEFDRKSFIDAEKIDCIYAGSERLNFTVGGTNTVYSVGDAQALSFLGCINKLNSNKSINIGGSGPVWGEVKGRGLDFADPETQYGDEVLR